MTDPILPHGWTLVPLMQVCRLIRGVSYKRGEESTEPAENKIGLLRANNIQEQLSLEDLRYVPKTKVSKDQVLRRGDVVIAMSSGSKKVVGKAASFFNDNDLTFGAFCGVLRPSEYIDPLFFGFFFQTQQYRLFISEIASGVNINNLKLEYFHQIQFPLPPLEEQHRIAAELGNVISHIEEIQQSLSFIPQTIKRFRETTLAAAYSGRLTEQWRNNSPDTEPASVLLERIHEERLAILGKKYRPPLSPDTTGISDVDELPISWNWTTLFDIAELKGGITKGEKRRTNLIVQDVPYLRVANVQRGFLDLTEIKTIPATAEEIEVLKLEAGDVLFNEGGDRDKLGRGWIWENQIELCIYQNHVFRGRMYSREIEPKYISWYSNSIGAEYFMYHATQTVNLASINITKLGNLPIPLPPTLEQREIVRQVEQMMLVADAVETRYQEALSQTEQIRQSLLTRAFRGELVPAEARLAAQENRSYETTAQLLQRIQSSQVHINARRMEGREMLEKTQSATSMLSLQELRETFQGKSFTREELQVLCPRGDEEYGQFIQTLLTFLETNPNTLQTVPSLLMEYLPDDQTYRFVFAS